MISRLPTLPAARSAGGGLVALRSLGYEPLGVVVGLQLGRSQGGTDSQMFSPGLTQYGLGKDTSGGFRVPEEALSTYQCPEGNAAHRPGYNLAFGSSLYYAIRVFDSAHRQLLVKARQLGAHGVIGIQAEEEIIELGKGGSDHALKWALTGTAVRVVGQDPTEEPFSTSIDESGLVALHRAGYRPVRLVAGLGAVAVIAGCQTTAALTSSQPVDVAQVADAHAQACQEASTELQSQAKAAGADLVIRIRTSTVNPVRPTLAGSIFCRYRVMGDAVARTDRRRPHPNPVVFSLADSAPDEDTGPSISSFDLDLLQTMGLRPAGPVAGASVTQLQMPWFNRHEPGEIAPLSEALATARRLAVERVLFSATGAGAVGVIGAQVDIDWTQLASSFRIGVSVSGIALEATTRRSARTPFVATIGARELYLLEQAGWAPTGLAVGVAVYNRAWTKTGIIATTAWSGGELRSVTESLYGVRELAMARLTESAASYGADGVIGVQLNQNKNIWGRRAVEISAVATAISQGGTGTGSKVHMTLPVGS